MKYYGLDWLILILNIYSYYLIGDRKKIGFILGLIGCVLGIFMFSYMQFSWAMIIMYLCFGFLNIKNYIKWQKFIN